MFKFYDNLANQANNYEKMSNCVCFRCECGDF